MLLIKKEHYQLGFTLIEMIMVVGLLGLLSVMVAGFLLTSLMASTKAQVTKEARQNGAYALSVMEGLILNSISVDCTNNTINVIDLNKALTTFKCSNNQISSNSAILTSAEVVVDNCVFECLSGPGQPARVRISFDVTKSKGTNPRFNEKASVHFSTEVSAKNVPN